MVYLDDIPVMRRTLSEHLENLQKVFTRLKEAGLTLKPRKCHHMQRKVEYLGHVVLEAVAHDPRKVEAAKNFPASNNVNV